MILRSQQRRVEELAQLARAKAAESARCREALRQWKRKKLASPEVLAWSFAVGALWGASRKRGRGKRGSGSTKKRWLALGNTVLAVWRIVTSQVRLSGPAGREFEYPGRTMPAE